MRIGIPKEIKDHEYRVGATPVMVRTFVMDGHEVFIEKGAGSRIGFSDDEYVTCGAIVVDGPADIYNKDMVIKVKEPQASEFPLMKKGLVLFCYLHLAPDPEQTKGLIESGVTAIAYETVTDIQGRLPLLTPMSEIAGRISIQAGATALQMANGGKGVLLGGVPGVHPADVVVIGGGVVGTQAARMAMGLGAHVSILDTNLERLRELDAMYGPLLKTLHSSHANIEKELRDADLVIGAVLIPGAAAPKLVDREMLKMMEPGTVLVDVAIDQGGCFETSRATTHSDPIYVVDDIVHYCVANMPGACARTATEALTNATMAYARKIANEGWKEALRHDEGLKMGLNVCEGKITNKPVARDLGYDYVSPDVFIDGQ